METDFHFDYKVEHDCHFKTEAKDDQCVWCGKYPKFNNPVCTSHGLHSTGIPKIDHYKFCCEDCKMKFSTQTTFCGVCHGRIYRYKAKVNNILETFVCCEDEMMERSILK